MRFVTYLAGAYLILLAGLVWGVAIERLHIFPYEMIKKIEHFIIGGEADAGLSLGDKIANDLNLSPHRFIVSYDEPSNRAYTDLVVPGINSRRDALRLYMGKGRAHGYRLVYGPFDFEGHIHAAVLLDDQGRVVHVWPVSDNQDDLNVYPHGIEIFPDGALVISFDAGKTLQKIDWCGKQIWQRNGDYTHAISSDGRDALWAVSGAGFEKINVKDGHGEQMISVQEIIEANPDIDILSLRQQDITLPNDEKAGAVIWQNDPWHFNDAEPLPAALADAFAQFKEGDLLISARSLNLVFVLDPQSRTIKWWSVGAARRQHDPDWQENGTISVFDNRMDWGPLRIIALRPGEPHPAILYDGARDRAYSRIRGKHQVLDNGNILITATQQGRVLEVTPAGDVVFELINDFNRDNHAVLVVSEARFLPESFFDKGAMRVCSAP